MIKHYCDICHGEILNGNEEYRVDKYKISISAYSLPTVKKIELCEECILKAIRKQDCKFKTRKEII